MSRRIVRRETATEDLIETYVYIGLDSPDAAERFLSAAERTFEMLAETPRMGRRWDSTLAHLQDVRLWRVKGFENWLVFYLPLADGVEILRVIHGARNLDDVLVDAPSA
jgi:toxin ParE1/3/4